MDLTLTAGSVTLAGNFDVAAVALLCALLVVSLCLVVTGWRQSAPPVYRGYRSRG